MNTQPMAAAQQVETTQVSFLLDTTFALKAWWETVGLGIVSELVNTNHLVRALSPKTPDTAPGAPPPKQVQNKRVEWSMVLYRSPMPWSDFVCQASELGTDPKRLQTIFQGIKFEGGHLQHFAFTEALCAAYNSLTRNSPPNKRVTARHVIIICSTGPIGINCSAPGCKYYDTWHEHVARISKDLGAKLSLLSLANTEELRQMLKMVRPTDSFTELKGAYASFDPSIELPPTLMPHAVSMPVAPATLAAPKPVHMTPVTHVMSSTGVSVPINSSGNPVLANSGNPMLGPSHMAGRPSGFQPTPTFIPGSSGPMMTFPPQPAPSKFPEIKPRPVTNSPGMIRRSNTPTPQNAPVALAKSGGVMNMGQPSLYGNAGPRPALGGDLLAAYPAQAARPVWIGNLRVSLQNLNLACRVQAQPANPKSPGDSSGELSLAEWNSDLFITQFVPLDAVRRLTGSAAPRVVVRFMPHEMQDRQPYLEMVSQFKNGVFGLVELQTKAVLIGLTTQPGRTFMGLVVSRDSWLRAQQATNQSQANLALAPNLGTAPSPGGGAAQFRPTLNQGQFQGQQFFNSPNFAPGAPKQPAYNMNMPNTGVNLGNMNYRPNAFQ